MELQSNYKLSQQKCIWVHKIVLGGKSSCNNNIQHNKDLKYWPGFKDMLQEKEFWFS